MIPSFLKTKPTKIIAVGLNYKGHPEEMNLPYPKQPILSMKPVSSIIGNEEKIILPNMSKEVDFEAELAVIIKKRCKDVKEKDAISYIEGFTCLNDITARDLQRTDGQWIRAKSFDTFCPIGPRIIKPSNFDYANAKIQLYLNGKLKQNASSGNLIFKIPYLVSFISKVMTLEKGDIISTGTPLGVGRMKKGDVVEVKIEGIGTLRNKVA